MSANCREVPEILASVGFISEKTKEIFMAYECEYLRRNLTDTYIRGLKSKADIQVRDVHIPGFLIRYSGKTRRSVFYLFYQVRGARKQRNLKIGCYGDFSVKEARLRAHEFRRAIQDGEDPAVEIKEKLKRREMEEARKIKVKDLLTEYVEKYSKVHKKASTQRSDAIMIKNHISPRLGDFAITDLDLEVLTDFYNAVAKATSFSTANHNMALVSHFWNWCETYKYLPINSNPCKRVKRGRVEKMEYKVLDLDGYKALFRAIQDGFDEAPYTPRAFRAIKVLALTGCRCSEITTLKKTDLDLENSLLKLEDSKTGAKKVPLGAPAIEELRAALTDGSNDGPYVFPATRGDGAIIDLRKAFRWALRRAKLPMMRIHDLRHSFATIATTMGEDIRAIAKVLGHSNTTTTEIYAHMAEQVKTRTANNVATAIAG